MKKFILATVFLLLSCTMNVCLNTEFGRISDPDCMEARKFKVIKVLENDYALAKACTINYDGPSCSGIEVLLAPRRNIKYSDNMYVETPDEKCAVQTGAYRYVTTENRRKKVPVVYFEYAFIAISDNEITEHFRDNMEDVRYRCKLAVMKHQGQDTQTNLDKCDCFIDFSIDELPDAKTNLTDDGKRKLDEEFFARLEQKCGKIPDFLE